MKLVEIKNNQPVTTSLQVAENFEKRHSYVLEAIDKKIHSAENSAQYQNMFLVGTYRDSSGKENKLYYMTKDGFTFIAMGFNGKKADGFKLQYIKQFNQMEEHIKSGKSNVSIDSETKRMNAEARLKNANSRQAKLLAELANDATTEVNKVLLQDRAVEILSGKKLLEKPTFKQKMLDCKTIAERLGILTKSGEPHTTAVSQLIQCHVSIAEDESEIVPFFNGHKSGSMTNYAETVLDKVQEWLQVNNYPSKIQGVNKNYHVMYGNIA